jgi:hypothetical protein
MDQNRIREISIKICSLLEEQSKLLNSGRKLIHMSADELDGYSQRNQRLTDLAKELSELV